MRGLKSKLHALDETIDDYGPCLIWLLETHLTEEEQIEIPWYRIYRNDGTKNGKGILVAVGNSIKTISVEVIRYDEVGQTLWILLKNQQQKIRVRTIYGPQENMITNNELKLYKTIAGQIEIAKEKYQKVLMVGDFNVKMGNHIPGNKEAVSKGGRQLKGIIEKYNLNIINAKGNGQESKEKRDQ